MMDEETNPVKDFLFEYIRNSQTVPQLISEKKFDQIIDKVVRDCYDEVASLGEKDEAIGILATGLLHYLLTSALITSQRKIELQGIDLDIVIPDIKTLEKDPKRALVICIPKSSELKAIKEKISELEKIQPEKNNIWVVLSENIPIKEKSFVLSKEEEDSSFSKIIFEIAQFGSSSSAGGASKFKILRVQ